MAIGDVYCVKMKQSYFTKDCLNVFGYRQTGVVVPGLTDAAGLFEAFDLDVLSAWAETVNTSITVNEVEVFQIADPTDNFSGTPTNSTGTRVIGDNLRAPSWICAGYKSNRMGAGSRSSFKRFAGLGEVDINDNTINPAYATGLDVQNFKAAMSATIESANGSAYEPVQIKSGWLLGFPPIVNFVITSWLDPILSSQVSRKP